MNAMLIRNKKKLLTLTVMLLTIILILNMRMISPMAAQSEKDQFTGTPITGDQMILAASAGNYRLFVNPADGAFYIDEEQSAQKWHSVPAILDDVTGMKGSEKNRVRSALQVEVINSKGESLSDYSHMGSVYSGGLTTYKTEKGVRFSYYFEDYQVTIPLDIVVNETGFSAEIALSQAKEDGDFRITSVSVLPFFNAGYEEEEGYLLVPDGSGALIRFNNNKKTLVKYEQRVYSYDHSISRYFNMDTLQEIRLPIYGIAHNNQFSLAIIEDAAANAFIHADSCTALNRFSYAYAKFIVRTNDLYRYVTTYTTDVPIYQKGPLPDRKIAIRYRLSPSDSPTYVDMGRDYREYLQSYGGMTMLTSDKDVSLYLDLYGATIRKKFFLGVPVDRIQTLTTYNQAEEILKALKDRGVENLVVRYIKWSDSTIKGSMKSSSGLSSKLGGKKQFTNLQNAMKQSGYELWLDVNPVHIYNGSSILSFFTDYAHNIQNYTTELKDFYLSTQAINSESKTSFLTRRSLLGDNISKWKSDISSLSPDGMSISGSEILYTDFRDNEASQELTKNTIADSLSKTAEHIGLMVTSGNDYTLPYAEHILDVPASNSAFGIEDESVPFYQIATHGLVKYSIASINSHANYTDALLRSVEVGAVPRMEWIYETADKLENSDNSKIYYSHYKSWLDFAVSICKETSDYFIKTANSEIIGHERLAYGVFKTTFDNGIFAIVNYNSDAVTTEYGAIDAKSFLVGGDSD